MSKVLASALPAARSTMPFVPAASKAAGVRFGSSWAHNQMHGARMFDAKLERMSKLAAQRGVTIRKPTIVKNTVASKDMVVAVGTLMGLTGTTAYCAQLDHVAHSQKVETKQEPTFTSRSFRDSPSGTRMTM